MQEKIQIIKKLVDELVEEYGRNIDRIKIIFNDTFNDQEYVYNSCIIYIALFATVFLKIIGISSACIYFQWYLKMDSAIINNINANTETVTY